MGSHLVVFSLQVSVVTKGKYSVLRGGFRYLPDDKSLVFVLHIFVFHVSCCRPDHLPLDILIYFQYFSFAIIFDVLHSRVNSLKPGEVAKGKARLSSLLLELLRKGSLLQKMNRKPGSR